MRAPEINLTFAHEWEAEVLPLRPLILPPRRYVYPHQVEEVERGALEVMVRPNHAEPFLATCALGFRDEAAAIGVWSTPNHRAICCVAGGYAYVIDTAAPEHFTFVDLRPVLEVRSLADADLLLLVGHRTMEAWGREGLQWESGKLSDEGVEIVGVDGWTLYGMSWDLMSDRELAFVLDLRSGQRLD